MSDTRKSLSSLPRKVGRLAAIASIIIGFGAVAGFTAASAAPLSGLSAPGLQAEAVGYKRALKRQQVYSDYYVADSYATGPSTRIYRNIPGGNNEIRELQRLFPETNWPPSLRY